ncbi:MULTISPECIES: Asp23/Gls24 family envelope stress response protein [unclassified Microbacterium]|uniref:Asp23/Gls24 family envelope stress response protein n=1 Tax=unclassified Microbacterium TaxID=2609290 RepID=UPI003870B2DF
MATDDQKTPAAPVTARSAASAPRVDRTTPVASGDAQAASGSTVIADGVVAKVAGIAAREIPGVHALGGGGARALGAIRNAINATDLTQGVKVEVGETQAAVDLTIVVEYPTPVHEVASQVRTAVAGAITRLVGLEVVEVNVTVDDVHLPGEDAEETEESRVS